MRQLKHIPLLTLSTLTFALLLGCDDDTSAPTTAQAGTNTAGMNTAGTSTAGMNTAGTNTAGMNTAGMNTAGVMAGISTGGEGGEGGTGGAEEPCGLAPEWRPQPHVGVTYVSHFLDAQLIWYRTDTEAPAEVGRLEMVSNAHDSAIDQDHGLLAVAHDQAKSVSLYQLSRPSSPGATFEAPSLASTINTEPYTPRFVVFDPVRARLHVLANAEVTEGLLTEMQLLTYDVSTPSSAVAFTEPLSVPVSTSVAIDARQGLMFLVGYNDKRLHLYDVRPAQPVPHPDEGLDLLALYPEENNVGFDPRQVRVDPLRGRVVMARAQGANSQLITLAYPPLAESLSEGECPAQTTTSELTPIADPFDVSVEPAERVNLLDAYQAIPVIGEPLTLFVHDAWSAMVSSSQGMISVMQELDGRVEMSPACAEFEGFGCYLRPHANMSPIGWGRTEGAACFDAVHRVVSVMTVDPNGEERGGLMTFKLNADGTMSRFLSAEGSTLSAGLYPISAVCD